MQPYLLPYVGYWQLMASVDHFILYDTAQYSSGGWVNRNRLLLNGEPRWFTIPVERRGVTASIRERRLTADYSQRRDRVLAQFSVAYRRALFRDHGLTLLEESLGFDDGSLLSLLAHSLRSTARHLGISTPLSLASDLEIPGGLSREERVIALARAVGGTDYYSLSGGSTLYSAEHFAAKGLRLRFRQPRDDESGVHPWALSIMHAIMTTNPDEVRERVLSSQWS